jgi:hypothetical protein
MAIKISTDCIVRMVRPVERKFNLQELNDHVNGFVEPLKIGPVWIMYHEKAKESGEPLNQLASFFFGVPMYGTVLVVSPHQFPSDWDLLEPEDYRYTSDDIDNGFLLSLQTALIHNRVFGSGGGDENVEKLNSRFTPIEEWTYKPTDKDAIDENTQDFYRQVYDYLKDNPKDFKKNVLLSDAQLLVKIDSHEDKRKMITQMIEYFIAQEEYEKCAHLQKVLED